MARRHSMVALVCAAGWILVSALGSVLAPAWARAQEVRWSPPPQLASGQIEKVDLVFDGCSPVGDVDWTPPQQIEIVGEPTESRVFSMVNFQTRTSVTLGFPVRARAGGGLAMLPAFVVETDKGPLEVQAARVAIGGATLPGDHGRSEPVGDVAGAQIAISDRNPFVGEVVDLRFEVGVDERRNASLAGALRWDPDPMLVEQWGQPEQTRFNRRNGVRQFARGTFPEPGRIELAPAAQDVNIEVGQGGVGLFRNRRMRTISVETEPIAVDVRPLPLPAPLGFDGAVGRFALESTLIPAQARVGEPLTWSLVLSGRGNWPDGIGVPPRSVPRDIEVIRPHSSRTFDEGALFEGRVSEDLVLIPTQPGRLELAPVRFVYFDPERARYETLEVSVEPVMVAPAQTPSRSPSAMPESAPGSTAVPGASGASAANADANALPAWAAPDVALLPGARQEPRMPREPIAGAAITPLPWSAPQTLACWLAWMLSGAVPVAVLVCVLGRRRAAALDHLRPRREALLSVDEVLTALEAAPTATRASRRTAQLLEWQRASAHVLGHIGEAPTEAALEARRWGQGDAALTGTDPAAWRRLWQEAGRAVHDAAGTWPADWVTRARSARAGLRVVGVSWSAGLRLRHLWPLLLVFACLGAAPVSAASLERAGLDAYASGDFAGAARVFAERVDTQPLDWKARSDLGLALLQLGAVEDALAQTASAWVLHPRSDVLRWNLAVTARRAGWIDPGLRDLAWGGGRFAVTRLASASEWQALAIVAASAGWFALGWAFVRRHRRQPVRGALVTVGVSTVVVCGALFMVASWGVLADRSATLVNAPTALQSLPTELAANQIEVALEPGRVVVVERAFLGWLEVRLANGDVGWIRRDALTPIYLAAPAPGQPWPEQGEGGS